MPSTLSLEEDKKTEVQGKKKIKHQNMPKEEELFSVDPSHFSSKGIALLEDIYEQNKKIKHRLAWMVFGSYIRLFFIVVPLVLSIIFLPPLLKQFMGQYSSIFTSSDLGGTLSPSDKKPSVVDLLSSFSPEELDALKKQYLSQ
ncbi:MAG: hypothetical protein GW939_03825 [Candidatus Magasanikbacteria bacterium]|nr:hypothetical protein [Candidatus Magasanikbacteria bacterium]NCS99734.1 hypothetical protein [Candidatus Parcubacteria bacterium]